MGKKTIAIIDYGSGNLRSAAKAFEHVIEEKGLDAAVLVTDQAEDVAKADRLVLPGQGAFGDCMNGLSFVTGMLDALQEAVIEQKKPFLGICVGMQLMATRGLEHGDHAGLDWIPAEVGPIEPSDASFKIPHMGWNNTSLSDSGRHHPVLQGITETKNHFYFVHSFMVQCRDTQHMLAFTDYGGRVTAAIGRDNMIGVQFHPEKSQDAGLKLIENFIDWTP